jgi:hypothetical protein
MIMLVIKIMIQFLCKWSVVENYIIVQQTLYYYTYINMLFLQLQLLHLFFLLSIYLFLCVFANRPPKTTQSCSSSFIDISLYSLVVVVLKRKNTGVGPTISLSLSLSLSLSFAIYPLDKYCSYSIYSIFQKLSLSSPMTFRVPDS